MDIKFPNYCDYMQKGMSPANELYFGKRRTSRLQPQCPRDYFYWSTIIVLWVTIASCLFIMSLASMARYYHEATDDDAVKAVNETKKLKRMPSMEPASPQSPRRESATTAADANLLKVLASLQETVEALSRQVAGGTR